MIYFYTVRLCYWKNNERIFCDYKVSCVDMVDFLIEKQKKHSSMKIYWIKPYYHNYY